LSARLRESGKAFCMTHRLVGGVWTPVPRAAVVSIYSGEQQIRPVVEKRL
jgi:hypothetical protein